MRKYETMYVLRPDLETEKTQELITRYQDLVVSHGGAIEEVNQWGKRRLAYELDGHREGFYVLMNYQAETNFTSELERLFRINDDVMRYITVGQEE